MPTTKTYPHNVNLTMVDPMHEAVESMAWETRRKKLHLLRDMVHVMLLIHKAVGKDGTARALWRELLIEIGAEPEESRGKAGRPDFPRYAPQYQGRPPAPRKGE